MIVCMYFYAYILCVGVFVCAHMRVYICVNVGVACLVSCDLNCLMSLLFFI